MWSRASGESSESGSGASVFSLVNLFASLRTFAMGCLTSKPAEGGSTQPGSQPGSQPAAAAEEEAHIPIWERRAKLDPKDYMFSKVSGETRVKTPGTVAGQGFCIEDCTDAKLYLVDHSSQVTVDECHRCVIFIGPTDGSVFARNCSGCTFVVATRQWRCRECVDCNVITLCSSKPVVESSSQMRFGCWDFAGYAGFRDHLAQCQMSPWVNLWSNIHDFTPSADSYAYVDRGVSVETLVPDLPYDLVPELRREKSAAAEEYVPKTWGEPSLVPAMSDFAGREETALIIFPAGSRADLDALAKDCIDHVSSLAGDDAVRLLHTNAITLGELAERVQLYSSLPDAGKVCGTRGKSVGLRFCGYGVKAILDAYAASLSSDKGSCHAICTDDEDLIEQFIFLGLKV